MLKRICLTVLLSAGWVFAVRGQTFLQEQLQYPIVREAYGHKEEQLKKEFEAKGLEFPARYLYIRSFKYDSQLEVWVKNNPTDTFTLFKSYRICALSGRMGPKRAEGDRQVPEGFYFINEFNPRSAYHLSLGLNYPNFSDRLHGDKNKPGGGIYIHGSCVSVGCIPLTNPQIEEVYILAAHARDMGQDFIPVHIFPVRFDNKRSVAYLSKVSYADDPSQHFWVTLKEAYDAFNSTHRMPVILFDGSGNYVVQENYGPLGKKTALTFGEAPVPGRGAAQP